MSAAVVPSHVRHYYRRKRPPFLNLSDLPDDELEVVRARLVEEGRAGTNHRNFGPRYMELRRRTESKMRELFIEGGGEPERLAPHYFVLGQSSWFEGLSPDMAYVELPLGSLPDAQTSFTHPDSFTAMALGPDYGVPYEPRPCHEQVFRLADLPAVVEQFGLPEDPGATGYEGYAGRPFEMYVEVQVWTDEPVAEHL
ncbi:MAG: hypothetical protein AAGC53_13065 [Actinomycetota bacterium]